MLGNLYASRRYFLTSLQRVPAIGKENRAVARDKQQTCAAAETGEVKDIRQVCDQRSIGANLGKSKPEPLDPAPV